MRWEVLLKVHFMQGEKMDLAKKKLATAGMPMNKLYKMTVNVLCIYCLQECFRSSSYSVHFNIYRHFISM